MREEKTEGPLVCSLNSRELVRRSGEISKLIEGSLECIERPDGFDLSFPGDEQTARLLLDFILKERRCCTFLTFGMRFESEMGSIGLKLGGSREARGFLKQIAGALGVNP